MYKVKDGCPGCGVCIDLCPINAIAEDRLGVKIQENCIDCGICAPHCPVGLIIKVEAEVSNPSPEVKDVKEKERRKPNAQTDTGI